MNSSTQVATHHETPAFFPAGNEALFGVMTSPGGDPRGVAVISLPGAATPLSTNVNGLSVRLCRRVASLGFHALRFDYHGAGESTGVSGRLRLDRPFVRDLEAAIEWLRSQRIDRFVLVGSCFGARTALATAARTEGIHGVGLISAPVRDLEVKERLPTRLAAELSVRSYLRRAVRFRTLRGLLEGGHRRAYARLAREKVRLMVRSRDQSRYEVSFEFLKAFRSVVDRGVPILNIYGDRDDLIADFDHARSGSLGAIMKRGGSAVTIATIPGIVHGFRRVEVQDRVLDLVTDWVAGLPASGGEN